MKHRRVTLKDIAGVAGVHHTTVSMALRNDRRLPAATRARIRQCAAELGYRPDPMLSALSSYRAAIRPLRTPSTIAFVTDVDPAEIRNGRAHGQFLSGVREGAESLGYKVDRFAVGAGIAGIRCLQRVLLNRSIRGVIIAMTVHQPKIARRTGATLGWPHPDAAASQSRGSQAILFMDQGTAGRGAAGFALIVSTAGARPGAVAFR